MMAFVLLSICLLSLGINGDSSRLLLQGGDSCGNCGINPCIGCIGGQCRSIPQCCLNVNGCNGNNKFCINQRCTSSSDGCPAIKCADPCIDISSGQYKCGDEQTCVTQPTTDPVTGCNTCPSFAGCGGQCGSAVCGDDTVCCNASCSACTFIGGFCTQQVCAPEP